MPELTSEELQRYLDSLDFEPKRLPRCKSKVDKERDAIRKEIEKLKLKENEERKVLSTNS
mgnify:CR=1 FL=1